MKAIMLLSLLLIASVLVAHLGAEDDQSAGSQSNSNEEPGIFHRRSSQCEPCGALRLPCCFPDLCQHRPSKISKCFKV